MAYDICMNRKKLLKAGSHFYAALVFLFFYVPVIIMVVFSFNDNKTNVVWYGFTTKWYKILFTDRNIWKIFENTVIIALSATILSIIVGTTGAVGLKKAKFKGKKLVGMLLYVPIIIPEIVLAVSTLLIFHLSNFHLGMGAMIIGNTTLVLPYVFITVKSRLVGMDPSIEEASLDLGANYGQTFFNVTLPAIMPSVVSGTFMSFTLSLDDLIVSSFLADASTTTLPIKVYSMLKKGLSPEINALTTIILFTFLICLFLFLLIGSLRKKYEKVRTIHISGGM
jgi:spermidine/putrescine transport system permease protein